MDEILLLAAGTFFCVLPVGLIIAAVIRGVGTNELKKQLAEHDAALHSLGDQNVRLHQRVVALEAAASSLVAPVSLPTGPVQPAVVQSQVAAVAPHALDPQTLQAPESNVQPPAVGPTTLEPAVDQRWQSAGAASAAAFTAAPASPPPASPPPASPPPASPPPASPTPAPAPKKPIQWEELLGVKGAAAVGAMVLVLAGLYFFKLSIDKNWITPAMRFAIGMAVC